MSATNLTGNILGQRQGCVPVVHTYPINFNTAGISSAVLLDTIHASATAPVQVTAQLLVVTAFNAVTTNVLTAGTTTTATEWVTAAAVNEALAGLFPSDNTSAISFTGAATAGALTATGLAVGDRIVSVNGLIGGIGGTIVANNGDFTSSFESVVSVADQIQQTASITTGNTKTFLAIVQKAATVNRFRLTADTTIYAKYTQSGTAATTGAAILIVTEFQENTRAIV